MEDVSVSAIIVDGDLKKHDLNVGTMQPTTPPSSGQITCDEDLEPFEVSIREETMPEISDSNIELDISYDSLETLSHSLNSLEEPDEIELTEEVLDLEACSKCQKPLMGVNFAADPHPEALSEVEALRHPLMEVECVEKGRTQIRLNCFSVMDEENHLVSFSDGLVKRGVKLYFNGMIKPILDDSVEEDPKPEGIYVKRCGPILEWWTRGFHRGETITIGLTTDSGNYHLQCPSEEYMPIFRELTQKPQLTKLVFKLADEAFRSGSNMTYEELLLQLEKAAPTEGLDFVSEQVLLNNATYIVNQIGSFDKANDNEEKPEVEQTFKLIDSACMLTLAEYSSQAQRREDKRKELNFQNRKTPTSEWERDETPTKCSDSPQGVFSKATTTPLIRHVFDSLFKNQFAVKVDRSGAEMERCGMCHNCTRTECGICAKCITMTKFGGHGSDQQECLRRVCVKTQKSEISVSDVIVERKSSTDNSNNQVKLAFANDPIKVDGPKKYYDSVQIGELIVNIGDFVSIQPGIEGTPLFIGRIIYLADDGTEPIGHVQFFCRGQDTVLGMTSDPRELFLINSCEDIQLFEVVHKVDCCFWPVSEDWHQVGGTEEAIKSAPISGNESSFWFRFKYDAQLARFESVSYNEDFFNIDEPDTIGCCVNCLKVEQKVMKQKPFLPVLKPQEDKVVKHEEFWYRGIHFRIGDACLAKPEAYEMPNLSDSSEMADVPKQCQNRDPTKYPEFYRFKGHGVKGSHELTPEPFRICVIESIEPSASGRAFVVNVTKIYRPENTHFGARLAHNCDLNYVLYSNEMVAINPMLIVEKCHIRPKGLLRISLSRWYDSGGYRFYFDRLYNSEKKQVENLSDQLLAQYADLTRYSDQDGAFPQLDRPLQTLDVFSGCGGLSAGLKQSGVSDPRWAVENYEAAAQAYQANNPECVVINGDSNVVLQEVMDGRTTNQKGQAYPLKGQVELLAAGPPCQGFSHMNIFSEREYSQFKNSLISTYLSYCDYFRPRFLLLENVMNFALFKRNLVLKLCLRALVMMGYQCTFGILQAGHFGIPQTRRRCFLMAAAPGEMLPLYPVAQHVFAPTNLSVKIDGRTLGINGCFQDSAAYRSITVKDAMGDLPPIKNGDETYEKSYESPPISHFQRLTRRSSDSLQDHICKNLAPLIEMRICYIPKETGSDWRDLPNIVVQLKDGTFTEKLNYNYHDYHRPNDPSLKGVCPCNAKKQAKCDLKNQQKMTLIPWCLPHTANRHNDWSGLYGRISWDGFFSTTVTNPEPISKQGRVLHPNQDRVVSVRECARSQGFPDDYQLRGSIMEKHRQIGNAVPPPMAKAIGREIIQAIAKNQTQKSLEFPDLIGL
uniref:DNA (cytosine-5)-methyltransferase n=1 Tax=Tigriopus japonicus TaxID=158387 RepID=A0A0N9BE15_TIGJA|nr:DNA (cytosine-5)-methyltransferase [Tigriopus japonicus]